MVRKFGELLLIDEIIRRTAAKEKAKNFKQ